ncbi:hypothetical protein ACFRCI_03480 [Streptomyces sp. NPDC056638]|uniref:hypothetical protein n=1 Tax=Streptomyces sp. NPDC056638 TaxID=3345887 RepID=UPI00369355BC
MSADFEQDLHTAVASVLQVHGLGMLSRAVLTVELVDDEGQLGLLTGTLPEDMPSWDRVGMLQYGLAHTNAQMIAAQLGDDEEEDED